MTIPYGMSEDEADMFRRHLEKTSGYLEFGCGGSTSLALESGVKRAFSVETDPQWIEKIKLQNDIAEATESGRLSFHSRDLGEVGKWGFPKDQAYVKNWTYFSIGVWQEIDVEIDTVFVDGRFRVACAIGGFLLAKTGAVIGMHDFTGRDYYKPVLEFGEVIDRLNNSIYLKRSQKVSDRDLLMALHKFMFDPR